MKIAKEKIEEQNKTEINIHRQKFYFIKHELQDAEDVIKKLIEFQVAIPS